MKKKEQQRITDDLVGLGWAIHNETTTRVENPLVKTAVRQLGDSIASAGGRRETAGELLQVLADQRNDRGAFVESLQAAIVEQTGITSNLAVFEVENLALDMRLCEQYPDKGPGRDAAHMPPVGAGVWHKGELPKSKPVNGGLEDVEGGMPSIPPKAPRTVTRGRS